MSLLVNLRLRKKLLVALTPLAFLVTLASLYASHESKQIDSWYSRLIDNEIKAIHDIDVARALNMRYGSFLYRMIVDTEPSSMHAVEGELENSLSEYRSRISEAVRLYPQFTQQITSASMIFEKAVVSSRPVRAAAMVNNKKTAADLMRAGVGDQLQESRDAALEVSDNMQRAVDQRSAELTDRTHRTILITWLVVVLGMLGSFAFASYLLNVDFVRELWAVRDSIQALAAGDLQRPIPFVSRPNEIGEISRSLQALQGGAREREILSWVKAEVAATGVRLQSAESFASFASALLSRIAEPIPLLYGCFYLADESKSQVFQVGTYACKGPVESAPFAFGEGLVGQCALERRILD